MSAVADPAIAALNARLDEHERKIFGWQKGAEEAIARAVLSRAFDALVNMRERAVRAEAERDASNARDIERTQALVNMRERAERAEAERDAARRDRDTAAEELRRTMAEYSSASLRDAVPAEPEVQAAPPACGAVDGDDTCDLPPGHRGAHSCVSVTRGRRSWQDD